MTTTSVLLCVAALLTIYSDSYAAGNVNCRKFVYHPKCRGVAAKRSDLPPLLAHRHTDPDRKQEEESEEYLPVSLDLAADSAPPTPRRAAMVPTGALWSYLAAERPNILLTHHKLDPDTLELSYDYE